MNFYTQRGERKIAYNQNFIGLQYKIIQMIGIILTQYQSCQQWHTQKFFALRVSS